MITQTRAGVVWPPHVPELRWYLCQEPEGVTETRARISEILPGLRNVISCERFVLLIIHSRRAVATAATGRCRTEPFGERDGALRVDGNEGMESQDIPQHPWRK